MMTRSKARLVLALLILGFGLLCGAAQAELPRNMADAGHLACQTDMDCAIVDTGSCPCVCNAKGMIAVNKTFAGQYMQTNSCTAAEVDICAEQGMCGQLKVAKCEQGRCLARMPY
ncbi:MAG: hypothetical protein KBA75_10200 [Alphaproteobacteria bacterium]|nr:hypothetical protein [Alphaproteobacteria bacterium]